MEIPFTDSELLYRAVLPKEAFWKMDGTLSSAVFKTRRGEDGISVDRQMGRSDDEAIAFVLEHLQGAVVAVSVSDVYDCQAEVRYNPIFKENEVNEFHSLVVKSVDSPKLTGSQSKHLATVARIVYNG